MSENKVSGIVTKVEGQSVFIKGEEYVLLANPFKFVNKLRVGMNVELSLNEDGDVQFFKPLEQVQPKPIQPIQRQRNEQLFGLCLKLANNKVLMDNGQITPEAWIKEVNKLAKQLHDEVQK